MASSPTAASPDASGLSQSSPAPRCALVTGASGQDGYYLCAQLLAEGFRVFGLVRTAAADVADGTQPLIGDLRDAVSLRRAIDRAQPDEIYNLAATTFVPGSWASPEDVADVNARGLDRLVTAIRESGLPIRLCHASSAEIFGAPGDRPQNEDTPLAPVTPYGESKAAAHCQIAQLREVHGLFACSAILFNHESPRRPPNFVTRKITSAVARIARGADETLALGNLQAARDWGYAPEYMTAMRLMMRSPKPRDYVVATGRAVTVGDFARMAFAHAGLDWTRHVRSDTTLLRPGDAAARIGDPSRIAEDLGWKATTSVEELTALMVDADLAGLG